MKNIFLALIAFICCGFVKSAMAQIQDPVRDYLSMNVPDRREYLDAYNIIYKATCDVAGDGKISIFIGVVYLYSGSKSIYWAAYVPTDSGYARITPASQDIPINLGSAFVGLCQEKQKQGILSLGGSLYNDNHGVIGYQSVNLLSIGENQLQSISLPALDLSNSSDQAFYNKYFGNNTGTRSVKIEKLTAVQLQQQGYTVPTWTPPTP